MEKGGEPHLSLLPALLCPAAPPRASWSRGHATALEAHALDKYLWLAGSWAGLLCGCWSGTNELELDEAFPSSETVLGRVI